VCADGSGAGSRLGSQLNDDFERFLTFWDDGKPKQLLDLAGR
jgi:hypothetical protein